MSAIRRGGTRKRARSTAPSADTISSIRSGATPSSDAHRAAEATAREPASPARRPRLPTSRRRSRSSGSAGVSARTAARWMPAATPLPARACCRTAAALSGSAAGTGGPPTTSRSTGSGRGVMALPAGPAAAPGAAGPGCPDAGVPAAAVACASRRGVQRAASSTPRPRPALQDPPPDRPTASPASARRGTRPTPPHGYDDRAPGEHRLAPHSPFRSRLVSSWPWACPGPWPAGSHPRTERASPPAAREHRS